MENSYLQRINRYPTTLVQAYNDLNNYQPDAHFISHNPQANDGVTFNTLDTLEETSSIDDESLTISTFATQGQQHGRGRGGQSSWTGHGRSCSNNTQNQTINSGHGVNAQARNMDLSHMQCFQCHQFDHYTSNCPVPYDEIVQLQAVPDLTEQSGVPDDELDHVPFGIVATMNLSIKSTAPKSWIHLDNASTVDIFLTLHSSKIFGLLTGCYIYCVPRAPHTPITLLTSWGTEPYGFFTMALQTFYHYNK